jgi:predicted metal-binding protein
MTESLGEGGGILPTAVLTVNGKHNSVQLYTMQKYQLVVCVHCAAHNMNLKITEACSVDSIRNCMETVDINFKKSFFSVAKT